MYKNSLISFISSFWFILCVCVHMHSQGWYQRGAQQARKEQVSGYLSCVLLSTSHDSRHNCTELKFEMFCPLKKKKKQKHELL